MKKCAYCGRENVEAAQKCRECGSALAEEVPTPHKPLPWKALKWVSRYIALLMALVLFYFLSLGPVLRIFTNVTITDSEAERGPVIKLRGGIPKWVLVVYWPAFWLSVTDWGFMTYGNYLRWWAQKRPSE